MRPSVFRWSARLFWGGGFGLVAYGLPESVLRFVYPKRRHECRRGTLRACATVGPGQLETVRTVGNN
jgi:hypothetical protein